MINPHLSKLNLSSKQYKILAILLILWVIRITLLLHGNADAEVTMNRFVLLQIFLIFCMGALLFAWTNVYHQLFLNPPTQAYTLLYLLGICSALWSIMPAMSGFFALQNIILLATLFCLAWQANNFVTLEKCFLFFNGAFILFRVIQGIFGFAGYHELEASGTGAALLCYCLAEYHSRKLAVSNQKLYRYIIALSIISLFFGTSSGANVSAACGILMLSLFAKNKTIKFCGFFTIITILLIYFFYDFSSIIEIIFPGKTTLGITTAHGRTNIWAEIMTRVAEKPWLGWGFACIERTLSIRCIDTHNSMIGFLGGLGYTGGVLFIIAILRHIIYVLQRLQRPGYRGLFVATVCLLINSNTFGFLGSKATWLTVVFFQILVLSVIYAKLPVSNDQQPK